jgi:lactate dehydrogenase-like 2-hydroxyacid dehydrogenase
MKEILIPDHICDDIKIEEEVFGANYKIRTINYLSKEPILDKYWESCDAILVWHHVNINKDIINKLKKCKVIVRIGAGYDSVDIEAAKRKRIAVCNVPDYGTNDVADHTMALFLTLARGIQLYDFEARKNGTWQWDSAGILNRLTGATFGIIGLGRIGIAVAKRAKAFGMRVVFYDPYIGDGYDKSLMIERFNDMDALLEISDIISFHVPLTDETINLADDKFFNKVKPNALIINTARGQIFEINSLYQALISKKIHAVGTDVLPIEPPDKDHPLIRAWAQNESWLYGRLIITPHSAFYNEESYSEMREKAAIEAKITIEKNSPKNQVNK